MVQLMVNPELPNLPPPGPVKRPSCTKVRIWNSSRNWPRYPLAIASGAGSAGRRILGTTVVGGMLAATLVAIFLIPAMFAIIERLGARARGRAAHGAEVKDTGHGDAR